MSDLAKLEKLVEEAKTNGVAFYDKGNDSAGTRFRNNLMEIKRLADVLRKNVIEVRNERKKEKAKK